LLYVRPVDESVEVEQQRFELVDGKGGEAADFQLISVHHKGVGGVHCVRPVDESVEEEQQRFESVDGKGGEAAAVLVSTDYCAA
jgi:hypothetical protein